MLKKKTAFILFALLFLACVLGAQQSQPPATTPAVPKVSTEDAQKGNPVKPTPESLAKGKKTYMIDCAMCHGETGNGKGDMSDTVKNITDFTASDAMKNHTDGELFTIIRKGKGDMPPEGDRAKNEDVWNLVNYIRSLSKK